MPLTIKKGGCGTYEKKEWLRREVDKRTALLVLREIARSAELPFICESSNHEKINKQGGQFEMH